MIRGAPPRAAPPRCQAALDERSAPGSRRGRGAWGGLDTASAAAHAASSSRIDTPATARGAAGTSCSEAGTAADSDADMDASSGFGGKRG